jgi:hypothetical protein
MVSFNIKLGKVFLRRHNISICMKSCISSYSPVLLFPRKNHICSFNPYIIKDCDLITTSNVSLQILSFYKLYLSRRLYMYKVFGAPIVSVFIHPYCLLFKVIKALGILEFYIPKKRPRVLYIVNSKE